MPRRRDTRRVVVTVLGCDYREIERLAKARNMHTDDIYRSLIRAAAIAARSARVQSQGHTAPQGGPTLWARGV